MQKTTIPQFLVEMDEGIKEIRELILSDADRQSHEAVLLKVAQKEKLLKDIREILSNRHEPTAVRVHRALERMDADEIPF